MHSLALLQQHFIQALQSGDVTAITDTIVEQGDLTPDFRINLYRTAYFLRFKETLETDHEILGYFLGDTLFDQMAEDYVRAQPSKHTSLRYYGDALPEFLQTAPPFNQHPIIAELATFERLLLSAFDAPNAETANLEHLTQTPISLWPNLKFRFHPSVQQLSSQWNAVEVWQAIKQKQTPPIATETRQHWIIWRNQQRLTEFSSLNTLQLNMFYRFLAGANYAEVCEQLAEEIDADNVSEMSIQCIIDWLNKGIISKIVY